MADCGPIRGLKLDAAGQKAIARIKDNQQLGKLIGAVMTVGVFNSIFTKSQPPVAGYNITQTDWELYAKALRSLPVASARLVEREIDSMLLHYQMPGQHDNKQLKFWRAMKNGCN